MAASGIPRAHPPASRRGIEYCRSVGRTGRNRLVCAGAGPRGRVVRARRRRPPPAAPVESLDERGPVLVTGGLAKDRRIAQRDTCRLLDFPPRGRLLLTCCRRRARDGARRWTDNARDPRSRRLGADLGDPTGVWARGGPRNEDKGGRARERGGWGPSLPASTGAGLGGPFPMDDLGTSAADAAPRSAGLPQSLHRSRQVESGPGTPRRPLAPPSVRR